MEYQVIIPAAGSGKRMGAGYNKLLMKLAGKPIISHTTQLFLQDKNCKKIFLVTRSDDQKILNELFKEHPQYRKISFVLGGDERQHSVYNGLRAAIASSVTLVHDGARPFTRIPIIQQLVETASATGAAIAAVPVKDTIKKVTGNEVAETVDRSSLWQVQTPQAFRFSILKAAHEQAIKDHFLGTDEASLVERMGHPVTVVESDYDNIKITTPEDLYFAEAILKKRLNLTEAMEGDNKDV